MGTERKSSPDRRLRSRRRGRITGGQAALAAAVAYVWPGLAAAQAGQSDDQIWLSLTGVTSLGGNAELRTDGLVIWQDNASRTGRSLARVVVLSKVSDRVKIGGGYVWTEIPPTSGIHFTEHRAVQEVDFRAPVFDRGMVFSSRTQVEERWREGTKRTSLRLRQRSRLEAPIGWGDAGVVVWNEYFHEFRRTDWSGPAGPSLMINFVGLHLPLTEGLAIEPGYLSQTQFDRGPNRVSHAAAVFASVRF